MRFLPFLFPILVLTGCLGLSAADRTARAQQKAEGAGLLRSDMIAPPFVLARFSKLSDPTAPIRIYIEGDGSAWLSRREPALNPTPKEALGLDLAVRDPSPNVVYLARPCHFVPLKATGNDCSVRDWTSDRFSVRVLSSYQSALDQIKNQGGRGPFELIGYSGGGYIALLLGGTRSDIASVRTVAGNLDNAAFTALHQVSAMPATVPVNDAMRARLAQIPQRHFMGGADTQVPGQIAEHYQSTLPDTSCVTLDVIPGVTHDSGWVEAWADLLHRPVGCVAKPTL